MNAMMAIDGDNTLFLRLGSNRVYFVLAPSAGLVKIGTTWRLPYRLAEIQLHSPVALTLVGHVAGGVEREGEYHAEFAAYRSHGEWFRYTQDVADRITLDCMADAWNALSVVDRKRFLDLMRTSRGEVLNVIPAGGVR